MANYGRDVSTFHVGATRVGCAGSYAETTGRETAQQQIARRLMTPAGSLFWDPDYGFDLRQFLLAKVDARTVFKLRAGATKEILKEESVRSARVEVEVINGGTTAGQTLRITITGQLADGPFTLVLGVSQLTVEVLNS